MSKRLIGTLVLLVVICLVSIRATGQVAPPLRLLDIRFGTMVENRELREEGTVFPYGVGRVYAWTEIAGAGEPTTITHVWYVDGQKVAEIPLKVRGQRFRTWSAKRIWPGEWKVEVLGADGNFLGEESFTVER